MENFFEESDVRTYSRGDTIKGTVIQKNEDTVLVDIGYKSEAVLRRTEISPFREEGVEEGEEIEVLVTYIDEEEGTVYVSEKQAVFEKKMGRLEQAYYQKEEISGVMEKEVKNAGYIVNLGGIKAFLPGSHLGNDLTGDMEALEDKEVEFIILEMDRREKNIVVSHREFLKERERKRKDEIFAELEEGLVIEGEVKSVVDFGIFVDIGGFEGLVHRSEISWKDLPVPPDKYEIGDTVKVQVLDFDREKERVSLSIKRLKQNPWEGIKEKYPPGEKVTGEVVSVTDFGAFIKLEEDVEGLVHISELSWGYPEDPKDVVSVGDEVEVRVLDVDANQQRISLSLRRTQPDPWENIEDKYPEGTTVEGVVTKITDFGAFVELEEGVEALLHISELSWEHVDSPEDVINEGDKIEAKVLKSDGKSRKIRLSYRELLEDPWHQFQDRYSVNSIINGEITEIKDFGAFMKITNEVEGLIHVSEISDEVIATPSEMLEVGDEVKAKIIGINDEKKQVRLSMRNLETNYIEEDEDESGHEALTMREHLEERGL